MRHLDVCFQTVNWPQNSLARQDRCPGEIDLLILNDNGKVAVAVLDNGGFVGLDEHRIADKMDKLNTKRN